MKEEGEHPHSLKHLLSKFFSKWGGRVIIFRGEESLTFFLTASVWGISAIHVICPCPVTTKMAIIFWIHKFSDQKYLLDLAYECYLAYGCGKISYKKHLCQNSCTSIILTYTENIAFLFPLFFDFVIYFRTLYFVKRGYKVGEDFYVVWLFSLLGVSRASH